METEELIYAGVPDWLLSEYLQDLGGQVTFKNQLTGDRWTAKISKIAPNVVGSLRVGRVKLVLQGDPDILAALKPKLELKTLRAGA